MTTDTMFSSRVAPWMKLGELTDAPVTAAQAAQLGGLNFDVVERPVYYRTPGKDGKDGTYKRVEDRKALVREDTGDWLSIVGKDYPVVQYGEAFDFMDSVSPRFVAAGTLRKGRQGFMVVQLDKAQIDLPDDPHQLFAVLRTSHDYSRAVEVAVMPLRGRCMNQLCLRSFAKDAPHRWSIQHTGDVRGKLAAAGATLENVHHYARQFESLAQRLMDVKVSNDGAVELLRRALPVTPRRDEVIERLVTNWHSRVTVGFEGTGWGLVNAVSEYFDWDRALGSPESRFVGALQGQTFNAINHTATLLLSRSN